MNQTTPQTQLVLYADDDRDDIALVEESFSATTSNIELVTAYDGEAALAYLKNLSPLQADPCLIILDINMPRLNGRETLIRIRQMERFRNIPVVLFTTSSLGQDKLFAEKYNAGFITKPLNTHQMKLITNQFLEHCGEDVRNFVRRKS
jgi:CheY-like chemotaxis protein